MSIQNRDGFPTSISEERRFFELYGHEKVDTPSGWNEPENWKYLEDISEDKTVGFAIKGSDYLFIDFDHVAPDGVVIPWARSIWNRLTKASKTYTEISMSGTGLHMIADLGDLAGSFSREANGYSQIIIQMDPKEYEALSKEEKEKIPKVEFFYHTQGRYIYLTGKHKKLYEVARDEDAASIFRELLKIREEHHRKYGGTAVGKSTEASSEGPRFPVDERTRRRILEALPYISANSRETWVTIGIALSNCGFSFDTWDEWSRYTDQISGELCDKYDPDETPKIWKSFKNTASNYNAGTIFIQAKAAGWREENAASGGTAPASAPTKTSNQGQQWDGVVPELHTVDEVEEVDAEYLFPNYIVKGELNILASEGGVGKTTLWVHLAAAISAGRECIMDNGDPEALDPVPFEDLEDAANSRKTGTVIFFSSEDSVAKTLRRRLRKAQADIDKVLFLSPEDGEIFDQVKFDSPMLKAIIEQYKPALVVFDPLQSFLPPKLQMASRNEMRQCMTHLVSICHSVGSTVLVVAHTNKRHGAYGRDRIADSADVWDLARSVIMLGKTDVNGIHYLSHEKANYSALCKTILFSIDDELMHFEGLSDQRDAEYRQALERATYSAPMKDEAEKQILEILADGEARKISEVEEAVIASGTSKSTLRRAKEQLKKDKKVRYYALGKGSNRCWYIVKNEQVKDDPP